MNVLSLFSGIDGLGLGLERAGMTVVGQVEIDPWCRSILKRHWPEVPKHDDVRTCVEWWLSEPRPAVDLVCGGFPCQPVSLAGKGLAQADPRWLWPHFADVIRDLRPRLVLVENVPGLLGRGMGDVLGDLAELGYDAEWDCISAAHVHAPHLRERIWIVAYPGPQAGWRLSARRGQQQQEGREGAADVANAHSGRRESVRVAEPARQQSARRSEPDRCRPDGRIDHATDDPDSYSSPRPSARPAGRKVFQPGPVERLGRLRSSYREHWATEPGVGRVAHGIPRRVDRLRGLGNAVVPQVAEHIGRLIMEAAA